MRTLICRLSALGDVVCSLPAASALKKAHPEGEVVWVCDRRFAAIPRLCSAVDQVVEWPKQVKEWKVLQAELGEFDVALDLQGLAKSGFFVAGVKAKQKLGYHWQREGSWLCTQAVKPDKTSIHIVDQYVDVARAAGGEAHEAEFALSPTPELQARAQEILKEAGWSGGEPLVIMNAGAGWATKRWPAAHFAQTANTLRQHGIRSAFIGAEGDRPAYGEVLDAGAADTLDLIGKTNIGELVAVIDAAQAHLAGDTGSTHIASALGRPAFGVYTMTRPERSCPYGQIDRCRSLEPEAVAQAILKELS